MAKYPYNTTKWKRLRIAKLSESPVCYYCERMGRVTRADTVDHIKPHKGNQELIWSWDNLRSLCKKCHDNTAQLKDIHGYAPGVGVDGMPLDDNHPWVKGEKK